MTVTEKQLKNLTPFKKGNQTGGRKKGSLSMTTVLKRLMKEEYEWDDPITGEKTKKKVTEWVNLALVAKAMAGSERAIAHVFERMDGKVQENIKIEADEATIVQSMKDKIRGKLKNEDSTDDGGK